MSPAQDQNEVAVTVTAGTARARGLRRISDLGPVAHWRRYLTHAQVPTLAEASAAPAGVSKHRRHAERRHDEYRRR